MENNIENWSEKESDALRFAADCRLDARNVRRTIKKYANWVTHT